MARQRIEHGQTRRVGDLKPHPKNSRSHSKAQIEQLAASLTEFDLTRPLFIDDKDTVLAGHGMREAIILKRGQDHVVAVSIAHGWTDKQKRAYVIADNQLGTLSEWDVPMLQSELRELQAQSFELAPMGFTKLSVAAILEPPAAAKGTRTPSAVISYTLVFDNAEQQQVWFNFVRKVKAQYPDHKTFAAKFTEFLREQLG